ncbi:hypothetical protein [Anaerocolumna xylanovorans]|uniref:Deacetylase PdaC domain-containing protein n=1 Tax=Anaerocolumna xylanovorans DSM 12503 TaxID=1121345 RepID=A0A1M7YKI2_9FIRM|nr:hypothetical protein [Anaerocolumna xylanovorans]SHO53124.1 hypothetical protein SAMN02745217_03977 [Anaerocolumna xylanovorans DSM 12503]
MNLKKLRKNVVIILCILIFVACSSKDSNNEGKKDNPIKAVSNTVSESEKEEDNKFPVKWYADVNEYGIAPSELTSKDMERPENSSEWTKTLVIKYPQLYNLEDYEKEKNINDMLYREAAYYHDTLGSRDYIEYSVDYEIMEANDDRISILFLGEVSDHQTSNRFAHAITIDIKSEKQLELKDFLMIDKSFVEDHLYTDFDVVENNFDDVTDNTPFVEAFVESFEQAAHTNDFYIKGSDIGIIIPTHDSMGYILIQGNIENK